MVSTAHVMADCGFNDRRIKRALLPLELPSALLEMSPPPLGCEYWRPPERFCGPKVVPVSLPTLSPSPIRNPESAHGVNN